MTSLPLAVGQTIELNDGRTAVIRFQGATTFAPGHWVGVELEEGTGKNDGSVKGERYFDCKPAHGMFLRATGISRIVEEADSTQPTAETQAQSNGTATAKTRAVGIQGAGRAAINGHRRESMAASPTPSRGSMSAFRSPSMSPTKQLGSVTSSVSTSRAGTPTATTGARSTSTAATKPRASLAPSSTLSGRRTSTVPASTTARTSARPSVGGPGSRSSATGRALAGSTVSSRQSIASQRAPTNRLTSVAGDGQSDAGSQRSPLPSPRSSTESSMARTPEPEDEQDDAEDVEQTPKPPAAVPKAPAMAPPPRLAPSRRTSSPPAPVASQRTIRGSAATNREIEELQTKLRLLEKRRLEDREKLKTLERIQQERDRFESIISKLQQKYQPQQQELADLKRQLEESESRFSGIENIQAEHDAELENATLDREMAEEQYEVLKAEVTALREKNEEMDLELEILREENQELSAEMSPEERTSQGWLQLERSNERLREALLRLREVTQEQEAELREQIKGFELDLRELATVKEESGLLKEQLLDSEAAIGDLKQQLDAAQGEDEIIEELSERNMALQEQVEELKATIGDLEDLRELNDELEVNHVESEKQMQEELDFKDQIITEQTRRSGDLQKAIDDYEMTVAKFREAFKSLQGDLEDMRASQQISETEAEDLTSKSRALMDLNLKLQTSAAKTQVRAIDLELKKLDAEEASEHLAIVQLFLPEGFQSERDSVSAFLRFKRIGFKSRLLHSIVKERVTSQDAKTLDNVFAACSVVDKLAWVSAMSDRFTSNVSACSVADFAKYAGALYEAEPVERALNGYIDGLRREEFRAAQIDQELQRSMAVMSHLASLHISDSVANFADSVIMQTLLLQSHLETTSAALSVCKAQVADRLPPPDDDDEDEEEPHPFYDKIDSLISASRSAKVIAGKAHRELTELRTRHLGLDPSTLQTFSAAEAQAARVAGFARISGEKIHSVIVEGQGGDTLSLRQVGSALIHAATTAFDLKTSESEPFLTMSNNLQAVTDQLTSIAALSSDLDNTTEFERPPAPWILRSAELKAAKVTNADTEAEVNRLNETLRERTLLVRNKEQELEEQGVRIEMLEARTKDASKRSAQIATLELGLSELKTSKKKAQEELERHKKDTTRLRSERDDWRRTAEEYRSRSTVQEDSIAGAMGRASKLELDRAKLQVTNLQATVRFLYQEKEKLRLPLPSLSLLSTNQESKRHEGEATLPHSLDWLQKPLIKPQTSLVQRQRLVQKEGRDVLHQLLNLATRAETVDLQTLLPKGNKLAWRPVRETSAWITRRRREEWETWMEWRSEVVGKANELCGSRAVRPLKKVGGVGTRTGAGRKTEDGSGTPVRVVGEDWTGSSVVESVA